MAGFKISWPPAGKYTLVFQHGFAYFYGKIKTNSYCMVRLIFKQKRCCTKGDVLSLAHMFTIHTRVNKIRSGVVSKKSMKFHSHLQIGIVGRYLMTIRPYARPFFQSACLPIHNQEIR